MNESLLTGVRANTETLVNSLSGYDHERFNQRPATGGWSAGEIAEHLLIFDIRINNILSGQTAPADRDPQEKLGEFTVLLNDTTNKITAPSFLLPSDGEKEPALLVEQIKNERNKMMELIREKDMNLLLPESKHRFYGELTGTEWVQWGILHCERHLRQLAALTQ